MSQNSLQTNNFILRRLDQDTLERIRPELTPIDYPIGKVLFEAGASIRDVHFPDAGVISVLSVFSDGDTIEMATIGREGMVGADVLLGARKARMRYYTQLSGRGLTLPADRLKALAGDTPVLNTLLLTYFQTLFEQVLISGACNGKHSVEERLSRWLLMMQDRGDSGTFPLTHGFLADMLGVHRPTISLAIRKLQQAGLIKSTRQQIVIKDRYALMSASCECYQRIRNAHARHLSLPK